MYSQGYGFSSSRVQLCKLDDKEGKVPKNWCFPTVLLEKTLESLSDSKEIKLVNPKGNNPKYSLKDSCWSWSSNTLTTWCNELIHWKRHWCWGRLKKRATENEMAGWHHWCNGHELAKTFRDGEGQGGLACYRPQGPKSQTQLGDWTTTTWIFCHEIPLVT